MLSYKENFTPARFASLLKAQVIESGRTMSEPSGCEEKTHPSLRQLSAEFGAELLGSIPVLDQRCGGADIEGDTPGLFGLGDESLNDLACLPDDGVPGDHEVGRFTLQVEVRPAEGTQLAAPHPESCFPP